MKAKSNPFAVERLDKLYYRLQGENWEGLFARLRGLRFRAAVVGPEGSGKTALLEELERRLPDEGFTPVLVRYRHIEQGMDMLCLALSELGPEHVVLLDSAGVLNWISWMRVQRAAKKTGGLIVSQHQEGRLPTLYTCQTSEALLRELSAELLNEHPEVLDLKHVYNQANGNLREAFLSLYDVFSKMS